VKNVGIEAPKATASVSFSLPKGCKIKYDMPMMVDKKTTVTITGKVTSISDDKYGKNFSIEPSSIQMTSANTKSTMQDEMREMRHKRSGKYSGDENDE